MENVLFSTRNIDQLIRDIASEVAQKLQPDFKRIKTPQKEQNELLDVKEAALYLRVKENTIYTKVRLGEIPYIKRSKKLYFNKVDLYNYLQDGRKSSISDLDSKAQNFLNKK